MAVGENKKFLWILAALALLALCIPSAFFLQSLESYRDLFLSLGSAALKQTQNDWIPRDEGAGSPLKMRLSFTDFQVKAPGARGVELIGDFNGWKKSGVKMIMVGRGRWDVVVPLPKGRCRYLFVIDGRETPDPLNPATEKFGGRAVSVKNIAP